MKILPLINILFFKTLFKNYKNYCYYYIKINMDMDISVVVDIFNDEYLFQSPIVLKRSQDKEYIIESPTVRKRKKEQDLHKAIVQEISDITVKDTECCENGFHEVKIGDILSNRYRIDDKLGFGGTSTVWLCFDLHSACHVALKIISSDLSHTEAALHEISMLESVTKRSKGDNRWRYFNQLLDHFYLTGANCTHICIVLELMEGNLIDLYYAPGGVQVVIANVKNIIIQILEAFDYLHSKCRIIHTDIKLDNVLYEYDSSDNTVLVQIADLGSCCSVDHPYSKGFQTREYRSHELLLGAPYGPAADIWSVACLAFTLATGRDLFDSEEGVDYSWEEDHLACTTALLGKIPRHVALSGKSSLKFFDEEGKLRYISKRESQNLVQVLVDKCKWSVSMAEQFVDFLLPMLKYDPVERASALECLQHPWLQE